jgi:crotonobetainyl-CoA:carnitine CoA-transferase CaiB-like acyl-CoA transferase
MMLGDYGAEVIKIEHPRGDPARTHGHSKDGHGLRWKVISRNKHFRPGVMEKWSLGPERLHELNPSLVLLRVTGFGQSACSTRSTPLAARPSSWRTANSSTSPSRIAPAGCSS